MPPNTPACSALIDAALAAERDGTCIFHGVYSHAGHSYAARDGDGGGEEEVWGYLVDEVGGLMEVAREVKGKRAGAGAGGEGRGLVLSVGATPTATVVQKRGFLEGGGGGEGKVGEVERLVGGLREEGFVLEVHAGV